MLYLGVHRPPRARRGLRGGYGPAGDWVRLFRRAAGYLRTDLLRDRDAPTRFVTIDAWVSREACLTFRERFAREFAELDARFAEMTQKETPLGEFDAVGEA